MQAPSGARNFIVLYIIMKTKTFTEKVYSVVSKIPKGKVMTYKQVAVAVGSPNSSRAVGTVLSKNYNPDVPCHRVIRSDGVIGNYNRGGMKKKREILKKEGVL